MNFNNGQTTFSLFTKLTNCGIKWQIFNNKCYTVQEEPSVNQHIHINPHCSINQSINNISWYISTKNNNYTLCAKVYLASATVLVCTPTRFIK